jgi:N-acetyl-gamma-glutamyl-phosphate reductase common form
MAMAPAAAAAPVSALVLGGSGYVAGDLLRLLVGHSGFRVEAVVSERRSGEPVTDAFPHLAGTALRELRFEGGGAGERLARERPALAVFSALPHGEAAARIDALLSTAEAAGGSDLRVVDLSADFRHRDAGTYAAIYGRPHAAPHRLDEFVCTLPELHPVGAGDGAPLPRHVAHPGCFTTAATLALAPFVAGDWIEPRATVVAVTGSTGAGRTPTATTHHPERRSDLFAYTPLGHRHEPEMRAILATQSRNGNGPGAARAAFDLAFVPHSGPFARGIHATIMATLKPGTRVTDLEASVFPFYESLSLSPSPLPSPLIEKPSASSSSFVRFAPAPPRLQSVVGTNRCDLHFSVRGEQLVIFAALDNLVKGAAGGAVQWMNRLFGKPDSTGLELAGLGWL